LNDALIDGHFKMIAERASLTGADADLPSVFSYSAFFFKSLTQWGYNMVKGHTKGVNVFSKNLLFIPVNEQSVHWSLIVVSVKERSVRMYNSMPSRTDELVLI
jgi:sentrin-specific protease 1